MRTKYLLLLWIFPTLGCSGPASFEEGVTAMLEGNFAEAYCQWKPLAQRGHAESQYNLGWLYANGNGMNVDHDLAMQWWTAAAEQGHADAQFAMGMALTLGEGRKQRDIAGATEWFVRAARLGHRDARDILARLNLEPDFQVIDHHPELIDEEWFGWAGQVRGDVINVREGPTTKSKVVAKLELSTRIRVVGRRGDWLQVVLPPAPEQETRIAWIYHTLIGRVAQ